MNKERAYNKQMESNSILGTKKQRRKKYREIIKELGSRDISYADIANGLGEKEKGFLDMVKSTPGMTMNDVVVLQQYAKAIIDKDTRAAEFLRDTAGEKPSTQIDMNNNSDNGLSQMSLEELIELRDLLKQHKGE